jgi:pimeloyl-ACP methyl ester carboxylesterase
MIHMKRKIGISFLVLIALFGLTAWWLSAPNIADVSKIKDADRSPGAVISVERLDGHNKLVLRGLLWWAEMPVKTPVTDGVAMFRVRYWSEINGRPMQASGLMALPYGVLGGQRPRGTVMYFHGTNPDRSTSPSAPGMEEGLLTSAIYAAGGYTLLAPDYIGLGHSREPQAYLHSGATVAAARDLVIASQHAVKAMKLAYASDLYLVGFSQGGHATAVVQRAFEATPVAGVRVKAAAGIAGAFDLTKISIPYAFKYKHSLYLGYLAHSYAIQYQQPIGSLLTPKYAAIVPKIYDGNHSSDAIAAALPKDPREMFLPERLAEIDAGKSNWFVDALVANRAEDWLPKAPLRLYYGDKDTDVSPQDSKNFHAIASKAGGNIQLMPVGPYAHTESAYHAVPLARLWFDTLSTAQGQ